MKKILVLDAHPNPESFCAALVAAYCEGVRDARFELKVINLRDLKFDLNLHHGYREVQELESDLVAAQESIRWCNHLVMAYPMWWGSFPALLKGFLDRCWLPGFAFKYHDKDPFWDKLLAGRSARMIVTSDAPYLFNLFVYFGAPYAVMKKMVLKFCGFSPVRLTAIGRVKNLSPNEFRRALEKVKKLGSSGI